MGIQSQPSPRTVGVIPARYGSTRLPGKSLLPIAGKPLIQHVVERAGLAHRLDALVVATDDERIADAARAAGAEAVMTRPDHPSGTDRVAEAAEGLNAEIVINIQGDEPLISPALIDELAELMQVDAGWDMATAATPLLNDGDLRNPSVVKVVCGEGGRALYFSRSPIPFIRDEGFESAEPLYWWHVGIYAYRMEFLRRLVATPPSVLERAERLEQLRALHIGGRIAVLKTQERAAGVDTPEDVVRVERLLREGGLHD